MRRHRSSISQYRGTQHRRLSPLLLTGILVPVVLALVAATVLVVLPKIQSRAAKAVAAVNGDCTLIVPPKPLTAQGLATPYQLVATRAKKGPCNEANPLQSAFIQAAVIDPATGKISIYDPLVIDKGTQPAVKPVVPTFPQGAVVGIWFGFNANNLTLRDSNNSLQDGNCVNGLPDSIFGQVSYCNAPAFFQAANQAISAHKLVPPELGKANDGLPCPTTRDFSIVDQDPSDNVTTSYIVTAAGQIAQDTRANAAALQGQGIAKNGSDERLLTVVDGALGCTPWMVSDLADPGQMVTALPLNELQAAAHQAPPMTLVPSSDPMVLLNNAPNLTKLNTYRAGVDQPAAQNLSDASTKIFCTNLLAIGPQRMLLDARFTRLQPSVDPAAANNLFTFLAQRFVFTFGNKGLNCVNLLGQPDPVHVRTDASGVAIVATIDGTTVHDLPNCSINGMVVVGCTGTTTINGQTCTFSFDRDARQVNIMCPAAGQQ